MAMIMSMTSIIIRVDYYLNAKRYKFAFWPIWVHLCPSPPPRGAARAGDGWLGEDGEGGGRQGLAGQPAVPARGSAGLRWADPVAVRAKASGRSSSLLSPQGAYWYNMPRLRTDILHSVFP